MNRYEIESRMRQLRSTTPLIGGLVRGAAIRALARSQGAQAVRALAEAAVQHDNAGVRRKLLAVLRSLRRPAAIDSVCQVWAECRDATLGGLIAERQWVASTPPGLVVLSALRSGAVAKLIQGNADIIPPLVAALLDAEAELAARAHACLLELQRPNAVDALCALWAEGRPPALRGIIQEAGYVAREPMPVRVLTTLLQGHGDRLTRLSTQVVGPLVAACGDADAEIAGRALAALGSLTRADARTAVSNEVARAWAETRAPALEAMLLQQRAVAKDPPRARVLSALKTGRMEVLHPLGEVEVEPLLEASQDDDPELAEPARDLLRSLEAPAAREVVCRAAARQGHAEAAAAARDAGYLPRDEGERALLLFMTEQWDRYEAHDFDHRLLRTAYDTGDSGLRSRILETLRRSGRPDDLAVVAGGDFRSRAAAMDVTETDRLIHLFAENGEWGKLWSLAFETTYAGALRVVRLLSERGWEPAREDERAGFAALRELASWEMVESPDELARVMPIAVEQARIRVAGRVNDVAFSPTGPLLAIGTGQAKVVLWDFQRGERADLLAGFGHSIGRVNFADGVLLCGERGRTADRCAVTWWEEGRRGELDAFTGAVTALLSLPEGHALAAGRSGDVVLYELAGRQAVLRHSFPDWARAASAAPDGRRALLLHERLTLIALPELIEVANSHGLFASGVNRAAAFAPDGETLIVGKNNGDVALCNESGGRLRALERSFLEHAGSVQAVEVLPGRELVITAGAEGTVHFTAWSNRARVGSATVAGQRLTSLRLSPDGAFMATGDSDATMSLWDLRVMDVPLLLNRPLGQERPGQLGAVTALATSDRLDPRARNAFAFLEALLRHRFRYDIHLDDAPAILPGEFDIEIEG